MNVEVQPWIADFRIGAALDRFPFSRVLGSGFLLSLFFVTFSAFGGRGVGSFLSFRPAHPPAQCQGLSG